MRFDCDAPRKTVFLIGSADIAARLKDTKPLRPFGDRIVAFLGDVSRCLMHKIESKVYPDVVTFAFWIRRGSLIRLKDRFCQDNEFRLGRGVIFHIAPSNVPINFAYSLVSGLLCGNANVVRVSSVDFPQIQIVTEAFNEVLERYEDLKPYVLCVRYSHNRDINDLISSVADVRIVWGGNQTITELRRSPLLPRSGEVTFADRYSVAVIDSDTYMDMPDKSKVADDFYNDTFFSDQNACTSPRLIVWMGNRIQEAKGLFWQLEHELVRKKYHFQPIQGVDKLVQVYLAASQQNVRVEEREDNLIVRVSVSKITEGLMDYKGNSGYFYENECTDIMDLVPICDDKRCQTVAYIGDVKMLLPLMQSGVKGIDRIVPVGKTMDFDLIWDGYNLPAMLTRTVMIR